MARVHRIEFADEHVVLDMHPLHLRRRNEPEAVAPENLIRLVAVQPDSSSDDPCAICHEAFSAVGTASALGCSHKFHSGCIMEWLRRTKSCPLCRLRVRLPILRRR